MIKFTPYRRCGCLACNLTVRLNPRLIGCGLFMVEIFGATVHGFDHRALVGRVETRLGLAISFSLATPITPRLFQIADGREQFFVFHAQGRRVQLDVIDEPMLRVLLGARENWKLYLTDLAQQKFFRTVNAAQIAFEADCDSIADWIPATYESMRGKRHSADCRGKPTTPPPRTCQQAALSDAFGVGNTLAKS